MRFSNKTMVIELAEGERIIAVVPSYESGPGWANAVVWVYIADRNSKLRTECIQPTERTEALHHLFDIGWTVHKRLVDAVPTKKARRAAISEVDTRSSETE